MSDALSYRLNDVVNIFPVHEIQKAKGYLNSVEGLVVKDDMLSAKVQGTMRQPYQVSVWVKRSPAGHFAITTNCSCPVRIMCKHAAAVMLSALSLPRTPTVSFAVESWIHQFKGQDAQPKKAKKPAVTSKSPDQLCYVLSWQKHSREWVVTPCKVRVLSEQIANASLTEWSCRMSVFVKPPKFVTDEDLSLLRLLWQQRNHSESFSVVGKEGSNILNELFKTNRFYVLSENKAVVRQLTQSENKTGRLVWQSSSTGLMSLKVISDSEIICLAFDDDCYYLDQANAKLGILELDQSPEQVQALLAMPSLNEVEIPLVADVLRTTAPSIVPPDQKELREVKDPLTPVIQLHTSEPVLMSNFHQYPLGKRQLDYITPAFRYGDAVLSYEHKTAFTNLPDGEFVRIARNEAAEQKFIADLARYNLTPSNSPSWMGSFALRASWILRSEEEWAGFMLHDVPDMLAHGWQVDIPSGFRHYILQAEEWEADFGEEEDGWFNLNMGVVVNGQRIALAPMLYILFQQDKRWLDALNLERIPDDETILLSLPEGGKLSVTAERIKPLSRILIELFDGSGQETVRLSRYDMARITELTDMSRWQFKGVDAIIQLAQELKNSAGVVSIEPPSNFGIELRSYQREGLSWLQFLREHKLAGILADDMGLGKTAQTLAHLLLEKQQGRMDKPTLVVLPTSLIFNWKREAERFAPDLKVLSLHGAERVSLFGDIPKFDIVLTTYPLLWRDEDLLNQYEYHYLILDEAQTVKNVNSQAAQVIRILRASHRLCLTGTPIENHLGELWAQFDFLLPGFLGDSRQFTKTWRTPIEKQGDQLRRDILAKRVRPFILRRRKEDVAQELPPKTQIIRSIELQGRQRDLYEAVRVAMDKRVREEIATKGFSRSHIVILEALLKLRQVCCDPRLVKLPSAQKVTERAKLDQLMEMLPELVDEGRAVLVFSQFTSMLDLISEELRKAKLGYTILTGKTTNREEVVRQFQDGEVPIFLISLKAGGVGLNLNRADTVIHFDPWWNPAVENQATDRAHRLGQTKNVFVYKLVVAGSIEERILALQERKADLAEGILSEDANGLQKFGESDIAALLEPLPN